MVCLTLLKTYQKFLTHVKIPLKTTFFISYLEVYLETFILINLTKLV